MPGLKDSTLRTGKPSYLVTLSSPMPKSSFDVRLVRKRFTALVTNAGSHGVKPAR
jgi:hypothetical protein